MRAEDVPPGRAIVLMYHRIAEGDVDPWSLCVSPRHFEEQLGVLREMARPISLAELSERLDQRDVPERAVVLTFDDGYADNLEAALPALEAHAVPATLFATSGYIGANREFWWDELEAILLAPARLPKTISLDMRGTVHRWSLSSARGSFAEQWRRVRGWSAARARFSPRRDAYLSIWSVLQRLPAAQQREALDALWRQVAHRRPPRSTHRVLAVPELTQLVRHPLIEVGAHTVTHPLLPEMPRHEQRDELTRSKTALESMLGTPVRSLSYPYGAHAPETSALAQDAGYLIACSTTPGAVTRDTDRLSVPRVHVHDWTGSELARQLAIWLR